MEIEKRTLEPVSGFSNELAFYLGSLEEVRNRLRKTAADLTEEELAARAFPAAHQIGNLILHLGESEAEWIWHIIAGKESTDEEKSLLTGAIRPKAILPRKATAPKNVLKESIKSARYRAKFYQNLPMPISINFMDMIVTVKELKLRCAGF